jgi:alkanesulfonate monooxygenase SsuD/methylene tetrahydromethanopterin reductase-like flavin-dependent oxidoreductase (luciferase family)
MAHLGAQTKRLRLGYSVALLPFNHPLRIAEEMLLLDRVTRGRIDLGIGRGHAPLEVAALCLDPDRAVDMFNDTVEVLERAFAGEAFQLNGAYWKLPEVQLFPPPVQHRPAFYMPITSPRSVLFAAEHGFIPLLGSRERTEIQNTVDAYRDAASAAGHPPERVDWLVDRASGSRYLAWALTRDEAEDRVRREVAHFHHGHAVYQLPVGDPGFHRDVREVPPLDIPATEMEKFALWGTRDEVVDKIREAESYGLRQLSISLDAASTDPAESRQRLIDFAHEVLPAVQDPALVGGSA